MTPNVRGIGARLEFDTERPRNWGSFGEQVSTSQSTLWEVRERLLHRLVGQSRGEGVVSDAFWEAG